jgi:hypothetical protein
VLLAEFVETLEYVAGKKAKLEHTPMPHSDVPYTCAAIQKAQKLIGYNPKISFEEGIQRFTAGTPITCSSPPRGAEPGRRIATRRGRGKGRARALV